MSASYRDVIEAASLIAGSIHTTPVLTSHLVNNIAGCELFFKCENLQKVGAFKARGAVNTVFSLSEQALAKGVATHSSGNHGAALARAAALKGAPAYIVVPENAKQVKKEAIASYGGKIITCEPTLAAREAALERVLEDTGAYFVHPYNDAKIIAGQGTAALELVEQTSALDAIVVPVGGGGLLAGSSLVAEQVNIPVYGAEPEGADDTYRSFHSGELVTEHVPNTICDGLLTTVGEENFTIIRRLAADILLATDDEVRNAVRLIWTRMKMVVEPSSAIALAVVLRNPGLFSGKRVAVMLTGGNVDLDHLPI